jgi:hypothetical protein
MLGIAASCDTTPFQEKMEIASTINTTTMTIQTQKRILWLIS